MTSVAANGIHLEYEVSGDPSSPPLLLISGLGGQLTSWSDEIVAALVGHGLFVIRFDNRDVGRSTWFDEAGEPDLLGVLAGTASPAYVLADMASDVAALLDALGVASAHVLGVSMGGMIAQLLAIEHRGKVRSLVSIMSTTGDPTVGAPHPEVIGVMLVAPAVNRDGAIAQAMAVRRAIGSPGYPSRPDEDRLQIAAAYDRAFHPAGTARQLAAIAGAPDRTEALRLLACPTLVIHGEGDRLIDPSGGRATAAAIPDAELVVIPGMGHDLPPELVSTVTDRVAAHVLWAEGADTR